MLTASTNIIVIRGPLERKYEERWTQLIGGFVAFHFLFRETEKVIRGIYH